MKKMGIIEKTKSSVSPPLKCVWGGGGKHLLGGHGGGKLEVCS